MLRALFRRSCPDFVVEESRRATRPHIVEACPPQAFGARPWPSRLGVWLGASGWRVSAVDMPSSRPGDALAAARLDFGDALQDVRTAAAAAARDRIAAMRSLHELWHCRGEVFGLVALRHDQAEAARRLAVLDRHFSRRPLQARDRSSSNDPNLERAGR
jgi:hypothetical protein